MFKKTSSVRSPRMIPLSLSCASSTPVFSDELSPITNSAMIGTFEYCRNDQGPDPECSGGERTSLSSAGYSWNHSVSAVYHSGVQDSVEEVLREALELPPDARAKIASQLIASLDLEADEEIQRAWAHEIARRTEAVRAGALRGEDWRPVLDAIERELLTR